ncbi:hypothetical protein NW755_012303 [Fusarium falciforme]|uniref:Uncharacterized protein n=1 Tax=Fusarium falciforme TaxID=195108 RepID=A0A9W8QY75_9HYPO|nr:hypothetical protein NW755_012303 [Fusarium falciforme]
MRQLLKTIKTDKVSEEDRLSVAIVVASMDFLSFAYEPYDEQMEPPQDLDDELGAIAQELLSPKFTTAARAVTDYSTTLFNIQQARFAAWTKILPRTFWGLRNTTL